MCPSKKMTSILMSALILSATTVALSYAHADDNVGTKIENKVGDIKTDTKKNNRAIKRHARKARGTDNVGKDVSDKMNDVGDDVSNEAKKAKRKAE